MKDAQCPETNEKSILQFLFLESDQSVVFIDHFHAFSPTTNVQKNNVSKDAQCSETDF